MDPCIGPTHWITMESDLPNYISLKPVTITFVNFAVSGLTSIRQLHVPLLHLSSTPNLITVIISTINSLRLNYTVLGTPRTFLLALSLKLLSFVISLPISHPIRSFHWHSITERIEDKLLSLTYKVLTTTQPPYLHNLISVQRPRSTRSSSVVTLARPPSSSYLKITDRFFCYASPCLWTQLPLALR